MSKNIFSATVLLFFFVQSSFAQYDQLVLLEHFTNTNCSVCGFRNPDLFTNLDRSVNEDVVHVSFYPSRPYADCKLNNHNTTENDNRTKYYGIFGSTPQITINGNVPNRPSFDDNNLFVPFQEKQSSFLVKSNYEIDKDSFYTRIKVESNMVANWDGLALVVLAVEDTVFYKGRNSENQHYNVFRRSFTGIEPSAFKEEVAIGDSAIAYFSLPISADWDLDRMYTIALLQNIDTKEVVQVAKGTQSTAKKPVSIGEKKKHDFKLTSSSSHLSIIGANSFSYQIIGINGQQVKSGQTTDARIAIGNLSNGFYILKIESKLNGFKESFKFVNGL